MSLHHQSPPSLNIKVRLQACELYMTRFAEMAVVEVVVVFLPGSWAVCDSSLSHKKTFILNTRGPVSTLPQVNLL